MSVNQVNQTTGALSPIAGGTLYADAPVGSIQAYGGATAPFGWLLCQGQAISRATYAELFGVIGTSFGAGDGSITFNIPDMREVVPVGAGTSTRSGIATHDTYSVGGFKDDQVQDHSHNYMSVPQDSTSDLAIQPLSGGYKYGNKHSYATTTNATGRHGETTHGKQLGVNYIIKATTIALPSDFEAAVDGKIAALDVASVGGSGKYISAISEADGKISATATNLSTTPTSGSAVPITSGGVYAKFASFDTWTDVTSAAVNLTNVVAASTSIKVYSNGRQCKIVGEYVPTSAQSINDGWISSLTNISIKAGYRPKYETALAGFFAANHHSPIIWYVIPSGAITGYLGTANSETTSISRIPINGMWYIA